MQADVDAAKFHADIDAVRDLYSPVERPDGNFTEAMEADLMKILDVDIVPLIGNREYKEAMDRLCDLYEAVQEIGKGDFYPAADYVISKLPGYWTQVLDALDTQQKANELERFMAHVGTRQLDLLSRYLQKVIIDNFLEPELSARKIELLDEEQERMAARQSAWSISNWALAKLRALETLPERKQEAETFAEQYCGMREIRFYMINRLLDVGLPNEARKALTLSSELDAGTYAPVTLYMREAKKLYRLEGKEKAYRNQLWELVTAPNKLNLEDYRELKSMYSPAEWAKKRVKVIKAFDGKPDVAKLYLEEGMYSDLLHYLMISGNNPNTALGLLGRYAGELADRYPQQILNMYRSALDYLVRNRKTREYYKLLVHELHRIQRLPGGKEFADEIVAGWRKRFRRVELLEELDQY